MDTKDSAVKSFTQKYSIIILFSMCLSVFISCLLIIQNRKLEILLSAYSRDYGIYGNRQRTFRKAFDPDLIEYRFGEFEREMNVLRNRMNSVFNSMSFYGATDYEEDGRFAGREGDSRDRDNRDSSIRGKADRDGKKEEKQPSSAMSIGKLTMRNGGEDYVFDVATNYRRENSSYEVEITMPKNFTINDINVSLNNSILTIRAKKEIGKESKDSKMLSHSS
ncbi:MAG: hypothetical protein LBP39_02730, partial [Rickettsiales bacterium]|nr:hypothetical protein [Rickettsiales bacterium]